MVPRCTLPEGITSDEPECTDTVNPGCTVAKFLASSVTCGNGYHGNPDKTGATCDTDGATFTNLQALCTGYSCKLEEKYLSDVTACNNDGAGCTVAELKASDLQCGTYYQGSPDASDGTSCDSDGATFSGIGGDCSELSTGCPEFEAGENEDAATATCVCDHGDPKVYCTAGQFCYKDDDDNRECLDAKPIMNKPSSECTSTANTAAAPLSATAAQAQIDKLKDMSTAMEVLRNYFVQKKTDAAHLTDCKAISTAWAAESCDKNVDCDSSSTVDTACCEKNSGGEEKDKCEDSPKDWRKTKMTSGDDAEPACCDICVDTAKATTDQYKDRCTAGQVGPSVTAICNRYTTNSGSTKHCYCGAPVAYLTANAGVEPITCGNKNLKFDPKGSCKLLAATVEAGFAMIKSKPGLTKDLSSWAQIKTEIDSWSATERTAAFDHVFDDMNGILMSGPTVTAQSTAPSSLSPAPDANSWDPPAITMNDLKDKDCKTCAAMINYPQLNADLTANGGMFYINGAKVFADNTLTFGGSGSAWITNTENNAAITATTAGTLMLHNIVNTGTIVATGIKGAVLSQIQNSGTVTLTDVVGNGVEIENLAGGTIEFKGNCKVDIKFKSAAGTVKFDDTVTGSVEVPEADAGNVATPAGVTKKTSAGNGDLGEGGTATASIGACAAAVGCIAAATLMQ
jgi:hypothetical protein